MRLAKKIIFGKGKIVFQTEGSRMSNLTCFAYMTLKVISCALGLLPKVLRMTCITAKDFKLPQYLGKIVLTDNQTHMK